MLCDRRTAPPGLKVASGLSWFGLFGLQDMRLLLEPPWNRLCIRLQDEKGSSRLFPFRGCFSMHRFGSRIGAFAQGNMRVIVWASCA